MIDFGEILAFKKFIYFRNPIYFYPVWKLRKTKWWFSTWRRIFIRYWRGILRSGENAKSGSAWCVCGCGEWKLRRNGAVSRWESGERSLTLDWRREEDVGEFIHGTDSASSCNRYTGESNSYAFSALCPIHVDSICRLFHLLPRRITNTEIVQQTRFRCYNKHVIIIKITGWERWMKSNPRVKSTYAFLIARVWIVIF